MRELTSDLKSHGIALSKPHSQSLHNTISRAAFKIKKLQQSLVNRTCLALKKECQRLVKKKNSVLKLTSPQDLRNFRWSKLLKEWKKEAPTIFKVLRSVTTNDAKITAPLRTIIGTAGALLLKGRNTRMSAVQHLVGLYLFLGRTRKKVFFSFVCLFVFFGRILKDEV